MNAAAIISLCAAALQLGMGLLLVGLARAPGWRAARTFALIALTAFAYSATDVVFALPSIDDAIVLWASRANFFVASLHAAAWLLYAFGGPTASARRMPLPAKYLAAGLVLGGAIVFAVGPHAIGPSGQALGWKDIDVEWAGVTYHTPLVRPWVEFYALFVLLSLAVPFAGFIPRARRGEPGAWTHLAGFTLFFACMSVEVLVTNGVISTLFLGDVGFLAVVIPVVAATVRRVVSDAQQLDSLSQRLAGEVEERTEALDRAQFALQESERHAALGRLAAGVGHEINNPLTYLALSLESIESWARDTDTRKTNSQQTPIPADIREALDNAREGTERIRLVVDGLRNYTRTTAGEFRRLSLEDIARSALRVASHHVQHVAKLELDLGRTAVISGDESRLVQVVVNLITNAAQAIAESNADGEIVISVRTFTQPDGQAALEVRDGGPGISPENLRRLAEPYFTTRATSGGTGLGLFLSRGIMEQHNGCLEIESTLGKGTVVRIVLPPAGVDIEGEVVKNDSVEITSESRDIVTRKRVLLIDDEPLVARVMARTLAPYCDVSVADSGSNAIAVLDSQGEDAPPFDVVLCDLMMPGMTGIELADFLGSKNPELRRRMLFLTGGAVTSAAADFLERDDVRFLSKPVGVQELVHAIDQVTEDVSRN